MLTKTVKMLMRKMAQAKANTSEQDWPIGEKTPTIPFHYLSTNYLSTT